MMQEPSFRVEDALELIRQNAKEIPYHKVYFTLRLMKVKPIFKQTVETIRMILVLHGYNIPIKTDIIAKLTGKGRLSMLHTLGDKEILILKREDKHKLEWILNPVFLKYYHEGKI